LSRIAAYYHDIEKIAKPEYFIENQIGIRNRHDKLSPKMSSLVLISHVREGVNLARKERLPQTIRAGIEQHHGTSLLTYFYHKAKRLANPSEEEVFEGDYRYPGPKPQRREFGVIMLADAVEAASRVLRDPTPGRLQDLARKLVMDKFNEMELDDCNLTLRDLHRIGESFLPVLVAFFHPRLDYPQEEGNEGRHRKDGSRGHPGETPEEAHREGPSAGRMPEH
jgi:putative nucleotidyltransferase with HDIG domain